MPLPEKGAAWPPATAQRDQLAEWSAWYSGDPNQLETYYTPITGTVDNRPAQFRGGVVGRVARWWWGQPVAGGEQRAKLHVPLAADICGTSADLLFSEPIKLAGDEGNTKLTEALEKLQENGLETKLHEGAEVSAALGGSYLRTVWDSSVQSMPWTEIAHPDGAVPTFRYGRLHAVTLWSELPCIKSGTVHRFLEHHEKGAIEYALYAGTGSNLGMRVPLQEHPDTASYAELVNEEGIQPTNISRLTVSYVPNMLPNRLDRRSNQGRSDLQGVTPLLDALDEAYSSWWRDIRHAKSRLHVPAQYLDSDGPGSEALANIDRELYVPLAGVLAKADDGLMIDAQQFAIRVTEHAETCKAWTERAIESAGYSTQSLSSGTGGAVTAAEVHAHERRSYMTRGKKVRYWTQALREHLATQVDIANQHLRAGITPGDLVVEFPDGVQESLASLGQTTLALRNAEAASTQTRVRILNPDWSDDQVQEEAARILAETGSGAPVPDPDAGF